MELLEKVYPEDMSVLRLSGWGQGWDHGHSGVRAQDDLLFQECQ